ncbi:terminase [Anaerophilus nitritogenes]|uniref:terminase n=1 Tax=Anaerophilus nitritogenes TaxID=2498136 RepID=UPI00101BFF43|nr:terminase [Anaerophilus nitritogenes]
MQHTKEDIQLLYKYLVQYLIKYKDLSKPKAEQSARQLMKSNNDKLYEYGNLAWLVGKYSIEYFCLHYLQDTFVVKETNDARPLAQVHYDIWNQLEQMFIENSWDKEEFILPRGLGKSTFINLSVSAWLHCYQKSRYTIMLGNREDDAVNFVEKVKIALQNDYILETFGKLVNQRERTVNKIELELTNNTKIQAFSSGTSVRGTTYTCADGIFRPQCIIADDYINENDILSDNAKEKKVNKWYKEVEECGDSAVIRGGKVIKPSSKFIIVGTPLAQGDFIDTIKKDTDYTLFHRGVVDFDAEEYFDTNQHWQQYKKILFNNKLENATQEAEQYYYDHIDDMKFSTIWEKYSCVKLANKFFNKRIAFMQELMCNCQKIGEKWFKSNLAQSKEEIEDNIFTKNILVIDPAGIKSASSRRDYFAFAVMSEAENGFKYVRLGEIEKIDSYNYYINHVIEILKDFPDITHVIIEKNFYNGMDGEKIKERIKEDEEFWGRSIEVECIATRKNKDDRISTIVDDVNNGRIIFCKDRVQKEALDQLMDFQGQIYSLHDDFADCIALGANEISNIVVFQKPIILNRKLLF